MNVKASSAGEASKGKQWEIIIIYFLFICLELGDKKNLN